MTAIPKAIAIANPTHIAACVATVAGVISSKLAIDAVANSRQDKIDEIMGKVVKEFKDTFTEKEF